MNADTGLVFQRRILNGLIAADDFVQCAERGNDVCRIGGQHDDALRVCSAGQRNKRGKQEKFEFHCFSLSNTFRRPARFLRPSENG